MYIFICVVTMCKQQVLLKLRHLICHPSTFRRFALTAYVLYIH